MPQSWFIRLLLFDYPPTVSGATQLEPRLGIALVESPDALVLDHYVELDRGDVDPFAVGDGTQLLQIDDPHRVRDQARIRSRRMAGSGGGQFLVHRSLKKTG